MEWRATWVQTLSEAVRGMGGAADPRAVFWGSGSVSDRASLSFPVPTPGEPRLQVLQSEFDEVSVTLAESDLAALDGLLPTEPAALTGFGMSRRQPIAAVEVRGVTYDREQGVLRRYRRVVVQVTYGATVSRLNVANPHLSVERSVLADDRWFKIPVEREGVYRVDRAYIAALGLDPSVVDPAHVRVYGNGGEPLPTRAGSPRPADLVENPVMVSGGGDGSFDPTDAVWFYAKGPSGWQFVPAEGRWRHYVNPFSNVSYQFLRIGSESGAQVLAEAPAPGPAQVLDRFMARLFVENDQVNLGQSDNAGSGYDWLGEMIDAEIRERPVLDESPPGMVAGTARFRSRVVGRSNPAVSIEMIGDGDVLGRATIPVIFTGANSADSWSARDADLSFDQQVETGGRLTLSIRLDGGTVDSRGWLDWLEVAYPRTFEGEGDLLRFHTPAGQAGTFEIPLTGFSAPPEVWDVTDISAVKRVAVQTEGAVHRVRVQATVLEPRELLAFVPSSSVALPLAAAEPVPRQNLHGIESYPEFAIIVPNAFRESADALAQRRRGEGMAVVVAEIEQVYNEFSGGVPDMRAVRDYLKFLYDRVPGRDDRLLRYALLFGDGHFDFRGLTDDEESPLSPNWIFPFETPETLFRQASYTSDDYFGLLDDDEGEWDWPGYAGRTSEVLDIGIGRLTVQTAEEAAEVVQKIFRYEDDDTQGAWRTRYTFVADDGPAGSRNDLDLHTQNADVVAEEVESSFPEVNLQKVYAISYPVETTVIGRRIPAAKADLLAALRDGTLVWNYSGHGGWEGLADEKLFILEDIESLDNEDRLTVFVTATCSFGAFDRAREQSGAERLLTHRGGGAVALMTTVRLVVTWDNPNAYNLGLNLELNRHLFERDATGLPLRLGEVMLRTKTSAVGMQGNNRKFNLLGDPSMRLALPRRPVVLRQINGADLGANPIALRALDRVRLDGEVLTPDGGSDASFDGIVEVSVFDAQRVVPIPEEFRRHLPQGFYRMQKDLIYRGKVSAKGGRFSSTFVVPRDISYSNQAGRISLYASSEQGDGLGVTTDIVVGGTAANPVVDTEGPEMTLFLNDTTFVSGGTTGASPLLIARFHDASGINTVGTGVGHEILLVIDEDEARATEIGDRFEGSLDSYQKGEVRYPLRQMTEGSHTLRLRAWDVLNNSTTSELMFYVIPEERLAIRNVFNYPNPMRGGDPTRFVFEHNQPPGTPARVDLRIYSLDGRIIRVMNDFETLPEGVLSAGMVQIPFDGRDADWDLLSRGVYLYKLRVEIESIDGEKQIAEQIGKLAVIR